MRSGMLERRPSGRQSVQVTMSGSSQTLITISADSTSSGATRWVRLATAGQPACVEFNGGTATANSMFIPANWAENFPTVGGEVIKVIQGGTAGTITATEMTG